MTVQELKTIKEKYNICCSNLPTEGSWDEFNQEFNEKYAKEVIFHYHRLDEKTYKDIDGNLLQEGDRIAFNKYGRLEIGVVLFLYDNSFVIMNNGKNYRGENNTCAVRKLVKIFNQNNGNTSTKNN